MPIKLRVRFDRQNAAQLHETPLSDDQKIVEEREQSFVLEATVVEDWQLHWWLLSFGDRAEVLAPARLREELVSLAR